MAEVEYPDGTIVEFPDDVPKITVDGISARYFDNTQGKFNYNPQPFEHGMFKNPLEGIPEAMEKGLREFPGQVAAIYDQFSPWAAFTKTLTGKTLQSKVDDITGNSTLVFEPDDFEGSGLVLGSARFAGNMAGDLVTMGAGKIAKTAGAISKIAGRKGFDNLMQPNTLNRQAGVIGVDDLPTDEASRMQRARDIGFDETINYRG